MFIVLMHVLLGKYLSDTFSGSQIINIYLFWPKNRPLSITNFITLVTVSDVFFGTSFSLSDWLFQGKFFRLGYVYCEFKHNWNLQ